MDTAQSRQPHWTRRQVLRGAAAVAAVSPLHSALAASDLLKPPTFAYVAEAPAGQVSNAGQGCIHVFSIMNGKWSSLQRIRSRAPASLMLSHTQRVLYVANDVAEDAGLPRGTVEAFAVQSNGTLTLLGKRSMALSGTHPRAMALSPDGRLLAVAAYGGGLYSLFPIAPSGHLGAPVHSYKQAGSGPHAPMQSSAHPHTLHFDKQSGRLIASDAGVDRLSVFSVDGQKLSHLSQRNTQAGSGPGAFVLHADSKTIFVAQELDGNIASYRYNSAGATIGPELQRVSGRNSADAAHAIAGLALHASGTMLYSAWADDRFLTSWKIDRASGRLSEQRVFLSAALRPSQIVTAKDGSDLLVLDSRAIHRVSTDSFTGKPGFPEQVAEVETARFVALKTL